MSNDERASTVIDAENKVAVRRVRERIAELTIEKDNYMRQVEIRVGAILELRTLLREVYNVNE